MMMRRIISVFSVGPWLNIGSRKITTETRRTLRNQSLIVPLLFALIVSAASLMVAQRRKTTVVLIIRGGTVGTMEGTRRVIDDGGVAGNGVRIVAVWNIGGIGRS